MPDETPSFGRYVIVTPSLDRQLAMDAFAAIRGGHPMVGLLELNVTPALEAIAELQSTGQQASLFAFMVRCIAVAISEHPDLNLVRHGKLAKPRALLGAGQM